MLGRVQLENDRLVCLLSKSKIQKFSWLANLRAPRLTSAPREMQAPPPADVWHEALLNGSLNNKTCNGHLDDAHNVPLSDATDQLRQRLLRHIEARGAEDPNFAAFLDLEVADATLEFLKEASVSPDSQAHIEITADDKLRKFLASASGVSSYMCFWILLAYRELFPCNLRCARARTQASLLAHQTYSSPQTSLRAGSSPWGTKAASMSTPGWTRGTLTLR